MHFTIYKITNLVTRKIYIGKHQTSNLDDGYMGSGKHLKRAITKYGIENFHKEILFVFDNETDMNSKEAEIVDHVFVLREDTYNICVGGQGGFSHINKNSELIAKRDTYDNKLAGRLAANEVIKQKYGTTNVVAEKLKSDENFKTEFRKKVSDGLKCRYKTEPHPWKGKNHSDETRQKMSKSKNVGSSNPQFGTMWITNGYEDMKIKKDIDNMPDGWYKGRKK